MNDYLFAVVVIVFCFCAACVTRYLIPYIKHLMTIDVVRTAVRAAEQTIKGSKMGKVKKAQVITDVSNWLKHFNIKITEAQLCLLIEAAVNIMNSNSEE